MVPLFSGARPEVESPWLPSSLSQVNVRVEGQVHFSRGRRESARSGRNSHVTYRRYSTRRQSLHLPRTIPLFRDGSRDPGKIHVSLPFPGGQVISKRKVPEKMARRRRGIFPETFPAVWIRNDSSCTVLNLSAVCSRRSKSRGILADWIERL